MASITQAQLADAKVFVGSKQILLQGAGPDDYFSVELDGDVGTMVSGVHGDVRLVGQTRSGFVATFTFLGASDAVNRLLAYAEGGTPFAIGINYNDFSITGAATVRNVGAWTASAGANTRTIVVNIARIAGDQTKGIGRTVEV